MRKNRKAQGGRETHSGQCLKDKIEEKQMGKNSKKWEDPAEPQAAHRVYGGRNCGKEKYTISLKDNDPSYLTHFRRTYLLRVVP